MTTHRSRTPARAKAWALLRDITISALVGVVACVCVGAWTWHALRGQRAGPR